MSAIKNDQNLLYCHFNKIIKEAGTSFQPPAFSQKHVSNFVIQHTSIWRNFILIGLRIQKISINVTCIMQQYLSWRHKFWNLQVSQEHKNFDTRERSIIFSSNKKNHWLHIKLYFMAKNSFVAEVNFKCTQMYWLLPHHYWQGFFALAICCHFQWAKNAPTKNGSPKFRSILYKC